MGAKSEVPQLTAPVIILVVMGSSLAVSVSFTAVANAVPDKTSVCEGRHLTTAFHTHGNFSALGHWNQTRSWNGARSWNVSTTSAQAQAVVTGAIPSFTMGGAKESGSLWMVNVTYNGTVVMNVPVGKVNTLTSDDAVNAVQTSQSKGWSAASPKLFAFVYNVPIVDSNGNTIGNVRVNGRSGHIITGKLSTIFRMPVHV